LSYKIDFVNNEKYGADDLNAVRTAIMTEGVIKKGDADCLVTLLADGIHIDAGEALFNDGCRIELTESHTLSYDGSDCYVFLDRSYYDAPKAAAGASLPENCIPLAEISGDIVTDMRPFATLKLPAMAPNRYMTKELALDFSDNKPKQITSSITFEDRTDINYLTFILTFGKYQTKVFIDFVNGCAFGLCGDGRVHNHDNILLLYDMGLYISYSKRGNTVTFDINADTIHNLGSATITAM